MSLCYGKLFPPRKELSPLSQLHCLGRYFLVFRGAQFKPNKGNMESSYLYILPKKS